MKYKINDYELIYMVREGNLDSFNILKDKYLPIIKSIAKSYYIRVMNCGVDFDDLLQEGFIGLYYSYLSFNDNYNYLFFTYANKCIRNHLNNYCRNLLTKKNSVLSNALLIDDEYPTSYSYFDNDYYFDFIEIKNSFNFKHSIVFELKYNGFSSKEISLLLDIPRSTVDGRLMKIKNLLLKQL